MSTLTTTLYPLRFESIYKEKLWGGQKIRTLLGKDFGELDNCGETWEISGVKGNLSVVADGPLAGQDLRGLIREYQGALVGEKIYATYGDEFPLLIKFIDANDDLSIQVHPDDELAQIRHDSKGKTEMWYIIQADEGSTLISGFNQPVNRETYQQAFEAGKLLDILNREKVQDGDVFFLPAGRVHTIGKGLLLAEIQQTSDVTYRIYDFDRTDTQGNKRELHVEQALDAIDYNHYDEYKTSYEDHPNSLVNLVKCEYFTTNKVVSEAPIKRSYQDLDSFVVYVCVGGSLEIRFEDGISQLKMGEALLLPATLKEVELRPGPEFTLLEAYIA
ncbi:MAG: type I phosphomannose isomerase catalytic subunit [Bacteroidota bacterium]